MTREERTTLQIEQIPEDLKIELLHYAEFLKQQSESPTESVIINETYKLSKKKIRFLVAYYIFLLLIGILISVIALLYESIKIDEKILNVSAAAIVGGIGSSLIGSSVFYLRKIYKSCINFLIKEPSDNEEDSKHDLGLFLYYFLRPFFSIAFSVFIHISLKASVSIITVKESRMDEGFIYLVMFLSFFGGFASGDLLTVFEQKGSEIASKIMRKHE